MDGGSMMAMTSVKAPSREFRTLTPETRAKVEAHLSTKPVPLAKIAKDLGVQVLLSTLPRGISGEIRNVDGTYVIKINRHEAKPRQRFTLAHELAHFLLHKNIIDRSGGFSENVLLRSGEPMAIEYEANRLASDLVMPSHKVSEAIARYSGNLTDEAIDEIAQEFGVSRAVAEIKLDMV